MQVAAETVGSMVGAADAVPADAPRHLEQVVDSSTSMRGRVRKVVYNAQGRACGAHGEMPKGSADRTRARGPAWLHGGMEQRQGFVSRGQRTGIRMKPIMIRTSAPSVLAAGDAYMSRVRGGATVARDPLGRARVRSRSRVVVVGLALLVAHLGGCAVTGQPQGEGRGRRAVSPDVVRVLPATGAEVRRLAQQSNGRAVLVNVWATWCVPCREEFPRILELSRKYAHRGLRVIFVSGDFEHARSEVVRFLAEQGVDFPTYLKTGNDMAFIHALEPRWSGALPATIIYDAAGAVRHFWEGEASVDTFEERIRDVLRAPATSDARAF